MATGYRRSRKSVRSWGMYFLCILYFISCLMSFGIEMVLCDGSSNWRSGPPDGLPELTKLSVECGKEEMTIYLEFSAPYDGTIYSKSNGQISRCIHIPPHSRITEATFTIEYDACGTRSDPQGKFYENTIVIQYDDVVIEAWDEAKKIRCEWHDGYEKSAYKMPITISDLDVVEMNFQGDDVDCWLEVQDGKGPWSAKVEGLVPLGSPLTLVVAIQDSEGYFDMRVKSCIAHDGHKHPIHLTDEDGCVLRPKMMTPFQKTTDTKGTASVIAYSHFYAFKFPETVEVTIQCTVEICRHGCPGTCMEGRDSQPDNADYHPPAAKDADDIPTYKDSHPFSTVITSRPNQRNHSENLNTSSNTIHNTLSNTSKEEITDPLETSPNTNHDFFLNRYPYNLFDDLMAEDRQDDKIEYVDDKEFVENRDDVYYSQLPGIFSNMNEYGKNFPSAQKIHDLSNKTMPEIETPIITSYSTTELPTVTEMYHLTTVPNLSGVSTLAVQVGMHTSTIEIEIEPNTTQTPILNDTSYEENSTDKINTSIVNGNSTEDIQERHPTPTQDYNETINDSIQSAEAERTSEVFIEPVDYNDALIESDEPDYDFSSNRKLSAEVKVSKQNSESHPEEYKARARKPMDNYEMRQNYHYRQEKPFIPPAPAPPITLYNGVPLYYYNHPSGNTNFMDRDGQPYLSRFPYEKEYVVKSKLRRPGRRGRREIGEKEQLGLKQTLRVIATTDLDFFTKDREEIKPHYVGNTDGNLDVCMAPSSLAAGLGLLLLANICVLCVVVFLGHHYYIHRKVKANTVELLCTELS